jgi:dihydrofolate reductase
MFRAVRGATVAGERTSALKEASMQKLIADMSMSVDGRIATPDDDISRLVRWFFEGDTEVAPGAPFRVSQASAKLLRAAFETVGAIIGGRRYFDLADGWGGRHPMGVPVYILTHNPPADWPSDSSIHFVTNGLESAVAQAREAAGDKDVAIATPDTVRQCLEAGILDELQVNIVPVALGDGPSFFGDLAETVELDGPDVVQGIGVTHLRYRVARGKQSAASGDAEATAHDVAQRGLDVA